MPITYNGKKLLMNKRINVTPVSGDSLTEHCGSLNTIRGNFLNDYYGYNFPLYINSGNSLLLQDAKYYQSNLKLVSSNNIFKHTSNNFSNADESSGLTQNGSNACTIDFILGYSTAWPNVDAGKLTLNQVSCVQFFDEEILKTIYTITITYTGTINMSVKKLGLVKTIWNLLPNGTSRANRMLIAYEDCDKTLFQNDTATFTLEFQL